MQANSVRAIVTGGVSGLGLAVAERLVADGGRVAGGASHCWSTNNSQTHQSPLGARTTPIPTLSK